LGELLDARGGNGGEGWRDLAAASKTFLCREGGESRQGTEGEGGAGAGAGANVGGGGGQPVTAADGAYVAIITNSRVSDDGTGLDKKPTDVLGRDRLGLR
jgi:hypothetical protein